MNLQSEINLHKTLQHPNIVRFFESIQQGNISYFLLEYAANGSLFFYIDINDGLPEKLAMRFLYQCALAVQYLHKRNFIHRDIKPENILLDDQFNIKLCDFGWSCFSEDDEYRTSVCGTYEYMSPEIVKFRKHNNKVDVWCLGILLYEMLHGIPPFKADSLKQLKDEFLTKDILLKNTLSSETKDILKQLLIKDDEKRPSIDQVLQHPAFKNHAHEFSRPLSEMDFAVLIKNYIANTDTYGNRTLPDAVDNMLYTIKPSKENTNNTSVKTTTNNFTPTYHNSNSNNTTPFTKNTSNQPNNNIYTTSGQQQNNTQLIIPTNNNNTPQDAFKKKFITLENRQQQVTKQVTQQQVTQQHQQVNDKKEYQNTQDIKKTNETRVITNSGSNNLQHRETSDNQGRNISTNNTTKIEYINENGNIRRVEHNTTGNQQPIQSDNRYTQQNSNNQNQFTKISSLNNQVQSITQKPVVKADTNTIQPPNEPPRSNVKKVISLDNTKGYDLHLSDLSLRQKTEDEKFRGFKLRQEQSIINGGLFTSSYQEILDKRNNSNAQNTIQTESHKIAPSLHNSIQYSNTTTIPKSHSTVIRSNIQSTQGTLQTNSNDNKQDYRNFVYTNPSNVIKLDHNNFNTINQDNKTGVRVITKHLSSADLHNRTRVEPSALTQKTVTTNQPVRQDNGSNNSGQVTHKKTYNLDKDYKEMTNVGKLQSLRQDTTVIDRSQQQTRERI